MNFETIIGLEVHVELKTKSKIFSTSSVSFGEKPNNNTNIIDWGYPGTLPIVNKKTLKLGIKAALALNCQISPFTYFDRKHYFYPDNPKGYQISQLDKPIGYDGWIEIYTKGKKKKIRIDRVHLEEDAGKSIHGRDGYSRVDLNRQGTPLIEIVSKPDINSPEEAYSYLESLRCILLYAQVSDLKMEEGSMRCDANISIRPYGQKKMSKKIEVKNLNSLNFVRKSLIFEEDRQMKILLEGKNIEQETRRFNEEKNETTTMRTKESSSDYCYFPDPDIPPFTIHDEWIERIRETLPEMPHSRRNRYIQDLGLPEYDSTILTLNKDISDFFENTISKGTDPKQVSNWIMGEISACLNKEKLEFKDSKIHPEDLADIINLINEGIISSKIAKQVIHEIIINGGNPKKIIELKNWMQLSDSCKLLKIINEVLNTNQKSIDDFKNGKKKAIVFLMGKIMKATQGRANPLLTNKLLQEEINKR